MKNWKNKDVEEEGLTHESVDSKIYVRMTRLLSGNNNEEMVYYPQAIKQERESMKREVKKKKNHLII